MKLVKLSVFALTMGLFLASCGGAKTEETKTDSTTTMATTAPVEAAAAPVDTTKHVDTMTAQPAKPAETKVETKTTTETKKK